MATYFLGVDNGGTMTKAALFDANGNEIAVTAEDTPLLTPEEHFCERDMGALWEATARVISKALETAGLTGADIAGIGCTGHGKGLYLWGKDNRPCCPAVASTDHRAAAYVRQWQQDGTAQKAMEKTLQNVLDCQPVSLLRWMKDNRRAVYDNIRWIFEAKDYIRFRLTGEAYAEVTDYSGTSLMNLHTKTFDPELLELFGIPEMVDALPEIRYSYDNCGTVTPEAAAATGLNPGTPVSGGMFDIDACAIAMDISREEQLCVITGTWSINEYISQTPVAPQGTTLNSLFCIPGYYLIEESSATSAGNLGWIANRFFEGERRQAAQEGVSFYKRLDEMVAATQAADSGLLFFPFLYGTNSSLRKSALMGMSLSTTKAEILRAVFEGVVFSHYQHIERLLQRRTPPKAIRFAGGAANSAVWLSLFADTIGIPLEVIQTKELGTLGAAMSAAVCAGLYADYPSAAAHMTRVKETIVPNAANTPVLREKYRAYCDTLARLQEP